jgi:repressor LexA
MDNLTKKQEKVLRFIDKFIKDNGYPPTVREMAGHFEVNLKAIQDHITALKNKRHLNHESQKARGLELIHKGIAIYGKVAAGKPIFAVENIEGYVSPSSDKAANVFGLKVTGDSMIDAGIMEGDVVLVHKQNVAEDKDIIIALFNDEATIKRLRKKKNEIYLEPANKNYEPIRDRSFTIIGKVIELRRKL